MRNSIGLIILSVRLCMPELEWDAYRLLKRTKIRKSYLHISLKYMLLVMPAERKTPQALLVSPTLS